MDKNRRNKRNNSQRKGNHNKHTESKPVFQFNAAAYDDSELQKEKSRAISELKSRVVLCPKCNQPITDITGALNDKNTGAPIHFDCALKAVQEREKIGENEKISYIGQGRFGVLYFENPKDTRHFSIKKIIEWEDRDEKPAWREEISSLYSKIN